MKDISSPKQMNNETEEKQKMINCSVYEAFFYYYFSYSV